MSEHSGFKVELKPRDLTKFSGTNHLLLIIESCGDNTHIFSVRFYNDGFSIPCFLHRLKGKMAATVLTGLAPEALIAVNKLLAAGFKEYESMDLVGQVTVQGEYCLCILRKR